MLNRLSFWTNNSGRKLVLNFEAINMFSRGNFNIYDPFTCILGATVTCRQCLKTRILVTTLTTLLMGSSRLTVGPREKISLIVRVSGPPPGVRLT